MRLMQPKLVRTAWLLHLLKSLTDLLPTPGLKRLVVSTIIWALQITLSWIWKIVIALKYQGSAPTMKVK